MVINVPVNYLRHRFGVQNYITSMLIHLHIIFSTFLMRFPIVKNFQGNWAVILTIVVMDAGRLEQEVEKRSLSKESAL